MLTGAEGIVWIPHQPRDRTIAGLYIHRENRRWRSNHPATINQPGPQLMAECLKELGFERDENATGKERTRKWRFRRTDNTGSVEGAVSAESPGQPLDMPASDTHSQGCLGNLSDPSGAANAGIKKFGKRSVTLCQERRLGSGDDDKPH